MHILPLARAGGYYYDYSCPQGNAYACCNDKLLQVIGIESALQAIAQAIQAFTQAIEEYSQKTS